jgi:hypothetical protein
MREKVSFMSSPIDPLCEKIHGALNIVTADRHNQRCQPRLNGRMVMPRVGRVFRLDLLRLALYHVVSSIRSVNARMSELLNSQ